MNLKQISDIENVSEVKLYPKRGIALVRGEGSYAFDSDGKRYLDFMTNLGVSILGYTNPEIVEAINYQLKNLPSVHQTFYSDKRAMFLEEIRSILPEGLERIIFTNTGAESVDAALKLAMSSTGRSGFVAAVNGYHGKSLGSLSVTYSQNYKKNYEAFINKNVSHVPFNDLDAIEKAITEATAAVIVEPILGEAGVYLPDENYLADLRKLCSERGVLLIFDEVQSAIRTGSWLAGDQYSAAPDIACFAKSFSYGIPFGFVATSEEIAGKMEKGGHGATFSGAPLACVAAVEVIRKIKKENLLENAKSLGDYFFGELKKLDHPKIVKIRGKGLWIGIELSENTTPYLKKLQDAGLIAASSSSTTIRFIPPINANKEEIDEALVIIREVFAK